MKPIQHSIPQALWDCDSIIDEKHTFLGHLRHVVELAETLPRFSECLEVVVFHSFDEGRKSFVFIRKLHQSFHIEDFWESSCIAFSILVRFIDFKNLLRAGSEIWVDPDYLLDFLSPGVNEPKAGSSCLYLQCCASQNFWVAHCFYNSLNFLLLHRL